MPERHPHALLLLAAYAAVYLIWGSTYLGVKIAVETLPPYLMTAARFLIAGGALYVIARLRAVPNPRAGEWPRAAGIGALVVGVGFGVFGWAQQFVASSLAAILAATMPLWMVLLDWLVFRGPRPTMRIAIGIVLGFAGIVILAAPAGNEAGDSRSAMIGIITLLAASVAYTLGSLFSRHSPKAPDPLMSAAMQMLAGGAMVLIAGFLMGEWAVLRDAIAADAIRARSLAAFAYLTIFGSAIAYTAYIWLLAVDRPARVATYAYVNPVVAVLIGWAVADERITMRILGGGAVILVAVLVIGLSTPKRADA